MNFTGELTALTAAVVFAFGSTLNQLSGEKIGPALVNRVSIPIGMACMFGLYWLTTAHPFPSEIEPERWFWLGASAVTGFWMTFLFFMHAFVRIGARLTLLIGTLSPVLSAALAWIFFDEVLALASIAGMALTLGGVVWVITEPAAPAETAPTTRSQVFKAGVLFAVGGAVWRALSFVLLKPGLEGDVDPVAASTVRLLLGTVFIWAYALLRGELGPSWRMLRAHPKAARQTVYGAVLGPAVGASLVLVSLQHTEVGISSTLVGLTPVFLLPIGYFLFHEQITRRALTGTLVAVAGTAILFL